MTRINKIHISTRKSSLSQRNFSPRWRNNLGHILLHTMDKCKVCFKMIPNNISSNPIPHMVVPLLLVPPHWQENSKIGRGKGERKQLRKFKHKGKHKIVCCPKYILIFTAYQVQGWWTIILSPVKSQPDGRNVTEIIPKRSCPTHLKKSNPYMFILQTVTKPPYGFCTHLFFASGIILIFGGLFLHRISKIIKVKLNWLRVPTTESARQKCRTRR